MATKTKNAERVAEHRERVRMRNRMIEGFIQEIVSGGGVQYSLTPVAPYPERDPLKNGIKITWTLTDEAREKIAAMALADPSLTFNEMLSCMDVRLCKWLLDAGFFQHDYRMAEEGSNVSRT